MGLRDGVAGFRSRRIDDAHERQQLELGDQRQQVGVRIERGRVEVALGGGQDPQALGAEAFVLGEVRVADLGDGVALGRPGRGPTRRARGAGPGRP